MKVPLLDLVAQYQSIKPELDSAIFSVLEKQHFILGPEVLMLEQEIAKLSQCSLGIGVSSGSDSILLSLMALDIGQGDEVITTPYTFFATAGAISRVGAKPVFCDISLDTYNINPSNIESAITNNTKAIIVVHLYGQVSQMEKISKIAEKHNLPVIEDAAQAIGAKRNNTPAGAFGTVGCFSFFPSKNLGACGDGGMIVCNNEALSKKIRAMRVHGSNPKYYHKWIGGNFRLDAIQAAILNVKIKHLDSWTRQRQQNASFYQNGLQDLASQGHVILPKNDPESYHIYNQFVIRVQTQEIRDKLREHLNLNQIGSEIYYPLPLHLQECFQYLGYKAGSFKNAEHAAKTSIAIPIFPELTHQQQEKVIATIRNYFE